MSLDTCHKCNEPSLLVLQKKDPFCKSCFLSYCSHKFKATVGKSKLIRQGNKVLIAYSGGLCSAAMLDMVKVALDDASHKKLFFVAGILHIDESFIVPPDNLTKNSTLQEQVFTSLEAEQYPTLFSSLEMVLRKGDDTVFYWKETSDHCKNVSPVLREKFCQTLENMKSLSARQDYLEYLRLLLVKDIARQVGYTHIFVGDCTNNLAVKLLSNMAMGRGSQIPFNMGFSDYCSSAVVCRPIREFSREEITQYNSVRNVDSLVVRKLLTKNNSNSSIQQLTETFVTGLQENFPATVYTIFRTGSKISSSYNLASTKCILCESPRDNVNPVPCSALEALSISAKLSNCAEKSCRENGMEKSLRQDDYSTLKQHLCHGCQVIFSEMDHGSHIPPAIQIKTENIRSAMREEIKDYIIQ